MICAVIFDLDGTIVQTETLKAVSYARAANQLCPECATEDEVIEAFKEVAGRPRKEVATALMNKFGLEEAASKRMDEMGVRSPWQAYIQLRLRIYDAIISDPDTVRRGLLPHQMELLQKIRKMGLKTGLATTTDLNQTYHILEALDIMDCFDVIATGDDIEHGKPDPEIYLVVPHELGVNPNQCIAIEDSAAGATAARDAGTHCIVVPTSLTEEQVHEQHPVDDKWIIDDPSALNAAFDRMIEEQKSVLPACETR